MKDLVTIRSENTKMIMNLMHRHYAFLHFVHNSAIVFSSQASTTRSEFARYFQNFLCPGPVLPLISIFSGSTPGPTDFGPWIPASVHADR